MVIEINKKENIKTDIRIPTVKHLQYPERKSKLLYSAFVEYGEATRKAIVENLVSRLGDIGKPFLAQREASDVFENIKQFFLIISKQRRKDVVSLRRAIIAVLNSGKVASETLEEHLSLKREIHTGIFEECRENRELFNITGLIEDLYPKLYIKDSRIPTSVYSLIINLLCDENLGWTNNDPSMKHRRGLIRCWVTPLILTEDRPIFQEIHFPNCYDD